MAARASFYDSLEYRRKQAERTKRNQDAGLYEHIKKRIQRDCARDGCGKSFVVRPSDPKRYCSSGCAASVNNAGRVLSDTIRGKISHSLLGTKSPYKGVIKVPRLTGTCANSACQKMFTYERYMHRVYCSNACAMKVTGGQATSPRASRGKAGIRKDISGSIYFYSRWEANMARLYTYLGVSWEYSPISFDIGGQMYTPDFYLPETDTFVEVKNFLGEYSRIRDTKFRAAYPDISLHIILKDEYLSLEAQYAKRIPGWEYRNTPFPNN